LSGLPRRGCRQCTNGPNIADGALIAYGPRQSSMYRQAARLLAKVMAGTKSADLPVLGRERSSRRADRRSCASPRGEQPTKFELVINLKTAKALGLTIPQNDPRSRRRGHRMSGAFAAPASRDPAGTDKDHNAAIGISSARAAATNRLS
jgi:hypothetical protein